MDTRNFNPEGNFKENLPKKLGLNPSQFSIGNLVFIGGPVFDIFSGGCCSFILECCFFLPLSQWALVQQIGDLFRPLTGCFCRFLDSFAGWIWSSLILGYFSFFLLLSFRACFWNNSPSITTLFQLIWNHWIRLIRPLLRRGVLETGHYVDISSTALIVSTLGRTGSLIYFAPHIRKYKRRRGTLIRKIKEAHRIRWRLMAVLNCHLLVIFPSTIHCSLSFPSHFPPTHSSVQVVRWIPSLLLFNLMLDLCFVIFIEYPLYYIEFWGYKNADSVDIFWWNFLYLILGHSDLLLMKPKHQRENILQPSVDLNIATISWSQILRNATRWHYVHNVLVVVLYN